MAKHSSHILEMARKGAEHRYTELKEEIIKLVKAFPHLTPRRGRGAATASVDDAPRKRRRMSAKGRAAISAAQKKRWARQRAAEQKR